MIFARSPIGVELYDADGRQLTINPAAMGIFGVSNPADIAGFNLFDGTSLTEEIKERLRRGEPVDYETTYDFDRVRALGQYRTARTGTAHLKYAIAPLFDAETGAVGGYLLHVGDITVPKSAQNALQRRTALDGLIAAEVARLATAGSAEIDECVHASLEEIARFLGAGNAYVVQASADGSTWSCTHEWCRPGVRSYRDDFQNVPLGTHAWLEDEILAGRIVEVRQLDDLPPEAEASRRQFELEGRKSYFLVPILGHDRRFDGCVGFSHFDAGAAGRRKTLPACNWPGP